MIKRVDSIDDAIACNEMLELLIKDEIKYNSNINENFKIKNYFENIYNQNDKALFAFKDDECRGYIYIKIIDSEDLKEKEALIDGLYVIKEYRNKGIGSMLVEEAKKWCLENNIKIISLNVIEENSEALNLYYKNGFKTFSRNLKINL